MTFSVRLVFVLWYICIRKTKNSNVLFDVAQGQRALDFVLRNQGLIDKTLLFDVELLKIVPN